MCGIAGAFSRRDLRTVVATMTERVAHRGPDDVGLEDLRDASGRTAGTFGHRRLAILDLSAAGHQPMRLSDGRYSISYNGEIYNFVALREELARAGVEFHTGTDTEVILKGFAVHGPAFLPRLRGMFAFAIWDRERSTGYLVRDPFGIKPLYTAEVAGAVLFASELRSVLASGLLERRLSADAVRSYLAHGSASEPLALAEGVFSLPPGTIASITLGDSRARLGVPEPYGRALIEPASEPIRDSKAAARVVRDALRDSVAHHLVSDVPVALFLSGGIDSTAVAALASEVSERKLDSFTITFDDDRYSEREPSRIAAQRFGTNHHEIPLAGADLLGMLPDGFAAMDSPSMDGLNTYALSRAVRAHGHSVVLSGLGGDELFAGYPSFRRAERLGGLAWLPMVRQALSAAMRPLKSIRAEKLRVLLGESDSALAAYNASRALFGRQQVRRLSAGVATLTASEAPEGLSLLQRVSWYELTGYMLNTLLRDSDVFSMAHGLELRVPFLDPVVAAAAVGVDDALKLRTGISKALLVDALRDLLPVEVWNRPKQGFTLPFDDWLRKDLYAEVSQAFTADSFARVGIDPIAGGDVWRGFIDRRPGVSWSRPWALYTLVRWAHENDMSVALPEEKNPRRRSFVPGWRSAPAAGQFASGRQRPTAGASSVRRVHLWAPGMFDFKGGIQVYQRDLVAALRAAAPNTALSVFIKNDSELPPSVREFDDVAFRFAGRSHGRLRTPHFLSQILRGGVAQRPDLVIVGHLNFAGAAYALKRLAGVPYWILAYGVEAWDVKDVILQRALGAADLVLSISNHTRNRLIREQRLQPSRVVLLPPTFNAEAFRPRPKPARLLERFGLKSGQQVILTVGRLAGAERYKGYDGVMAALPAVREAFPDVRYIIVGEGDDRPRVERQVKELGLGDCVILAGFVPDAELRDYYSLCDVFAMPSKREGFGIVYLEAAACGKPVIGGNQDGAVDALNWGDFGALVNPDSPEHISATLIRLLEQQYPSPLMYDGERLREAVIEKYGVAQFRRTLEQHLQAHTWPKGRGNRTAAAVE